MDSAPFFKLVSINIIIITNMRSRTSSYFRLVHSRATFEVMLDSWHVHRKRSEVLLGSQHVCSRRSAVWLDSKHVYSIGSEVQLASCYV